MRRASQSSMEQWRRSCHVLVTVVTPNVKSSSPVFYAPVIALVSVVRYRTEILILLQEN